MIGEYRNKLERVKGTLSHLKKEKDNLTIEIEKNKNESNEWDQALKHLQIVAQKTQQTLEYKISEICTLAEEAVFDNPYKIETKFNIKRNKTECDIMFLKGGKRVGKPLEGCGYGAIDVAAFALRPALICIKRPKVRNLLLVDEPFRNVGDGLADVKVLQQRTSEMVSQISKNLGMQIIMVSHNKEIITSADNVINI